MKLISGLINPDFIANDKRRKELMERLEKGKITRDIYGNLVSLFSGTKKHFLFCCVFIPLFSENEKCFLFCCIFLPLFSETEKCFLFCPSFLP